MKRDLFNREGFPPIEPHTWRRGIGFVAISTEASTSISRLLFLGEILKGPYHEALPTFDTLHLQANELGS